MRELRKDWRDIFQGFRIALDPKKMLLGLVWAYCAIILAAALLALLPGDVASPCQQVMIKCVKNPVAAGCDLVRWCGMVAEGRASLVEKLAGLRAASCTYLADFTWKTALCAGSLFLVYVLATLLLWANLGGPILRLCAVQFLRDETIPLAEATEFAKQKRWSFFWSPLTSFIVVGLLCLPIIALGVIGRIPWLGPLVVAAFFICAILTGLFMALVLIGGVFGIGLMGPTIAVEGTDTFDAISRAFGYVYQKPWRFIWYNLVATAYGFVVTVFVATVAYLSFMMPARICAWAMGHNFEEIMNLLRYWDFVESPGWTVWLAAWVVKILAVFVAGTVLGFIVSYWCTSQTIIYALLRKDVDGTDMTEIYMEEEEEDFAAFEAAAPAEAETAPAEEKAEEASAEEETAEPEPAATKKKKKTSKKKSKRKTTRKRKKKAKGTE